MNENNANFTPDAPNFKTLVRMNFQGLTNFPYIEEDFDALTNYGLLSKVVEYLNEVISNNNEQNTLMTGLYDAYVSLQNYVNDYFDNLDVQDEINNKLDEMAQDGTMTNLIKGYVDPYINAQNQAIENIHNEVISLASGSPKGVYSTVSALESANPATGVYIVSADGHIYSWTKDGTDAIDLGLYQAVGIDDNSVSVYKTNFYDKIGLIPKYNWITGKWINVTTGEITNYGQGCYNEEYIPIDNTKKLISFVQNGIRIIYYDSSKQFISGDSVPNNDYITPPETAAYVRFSRGGSNPFTILPDTYTQIYYADSYILSNFINTKLKDSFNYLNFNNIYGTQKFMMIKKYGNTTFTQTGNTYHITSAGIVGFYFQHNLQVGDVITIKQSNIIHGNLNSSFTIYTWDGTTQTQVVAQALNSDRYGEVEIDSDLYSAINGKQLLIVTSGTLDSSGMDFEFTINVKGQYYNLPDFVERVDNSLNTLNTKVIGKKYKGMFLGDSITAMSGPSGQYNTGWIHWFKDIVQLSSLTNIAQNGAWLQDKDSTEAYTGELVSGDDPQNVLGNQVQYLLNNSIDEPDFIIIAVGTNSGITANNENEIYTNYYNNGNAVSLDNLDRTTSAGAFRWCLEKLHNKYPNALIFWSAPIHKGGNNYKAVVTWYNNLKQFCDVAGVKCIDSLNCGIQSNGSGDYTEFLHDNLHTNEKGAKYLGRYIASQVKTIIESTK